jgi:hypothetical protein
MKRILHAFVALSVLMAGCGSAADDSGDTDSGPTTTTTTSTTTSTTESGEETLTYPVVDTGQVAFYDAESEIAEPAKGEAFYGQDAAHDGNQPSYTDNGDGTVTDDVAGLVWQQSADIDGDGDIDAADKLSYAAALDYCEGLSLGDRDDWQLPTIKQLYSL